LSRRLEVLCLVTDAYGGTGGIAQYNRDIVEAIAAHPAVAGVTVIPRLIAREVPAMPKGVTHLTEAAGSKLAYVSAVTRVSHRGAFDLVVCGHVNLMPVAYPAALRIGAPLILMVYGAEVWDRKSSMLRRLVGRADAVTSISRLTWERMSQWSTFDEKNVFILPNAIDLDEFDRRLAAKPDYPVQGKPVLLTLGRMDPVERGKGFDEIIEVMPDLIAEYPGITYYAAGDGLDRPRLQQKARELGVEQHVVFPGYISEEDKPALFRAADLYVMPGRLEGFGYVFLEALAAETPVIGSTLDGSREAMMDGKWGALVDPRDRSALIGAIRTALAKNEVPPRGDLAYFSTSQFKERTKAMLNTVLELDKTDRPA